MGRIILISNNLCKLRERSGKMIKQLKGLKFKDKKEKNKWKLVVNLGYDPETNTYPRRTRIFYGNDRESDAALRDFIFELEHPQLIISSILLRDWLNEWYHDYYKPNTEHNTSTRAEVEIRLHINPYIGHIPLGELTTEHIQTVYILLRKEGKITRKKDNNGEIIITKSPLSPRTVKYTHTVLNQALDQAVDLGRIPSNPCKKAKLPKNKEKPKEKWVVLSAPELKTFLNDIKCMNHRDYALIFIAAYSGCRQSELLGLTKDRILWDKLAIRIEQTLHIDDNAEDGFDHRPRTKNSQSTRTVKLSSVAIDVLRRHIKKQEEAGIEGNLVFTEPDGKPIARNNLGTRFSNLVTKLGYPGMTFHHLRHTHATILLASGVYINDVSKRLGHANPKITLDTYAHCLPQGEDILVQQFNKLMDIQEK